MPSAEHEAVVAMLQAGDGPLAGDVATQRATMDAMGTAMPLVAGTECHEYVADGVPVTWVAASGADARRAIVYLHGGGYVLGSRAGYVSLASRISAAAGARVLLVEYRLAPENPFPAAVDDALTVWNWLFTQGITAGHTAIAGDSAGGGLTLALLQRIRETGAPMPACAVCLSPWADLEASGATAAPGTVDDPMITTDVLLERGRHYAGEATADPLASPIHADYAGFPPLLIQVGTREVLLSDAHRVAERARAAGVDVTLEEEEGLIHVWQIFPDVPESDAAIQRIGFYVDGKLA